jgi:hypothetical protein
VIVDAFVSLLFGFLAFVFGLLPEFTEPSFGGSCMVAGSPAVEPVCSGNQVGGYLARAAAFVDVSLLLTCVLIVIGTFVAVAVVRGVLFVYERLPGKMS